METYQRMKARSHGQTHYFFSPVSSALLKQQKVQEGLLPKRIQEYLGNENAMIEPCNYVEWDLVPRRLKHKL